MLCLLLALATALPGMSEGAAAPPGAVTWASKLPPPGPRWSFMVFGDNRGDTKILGRLIALSTRRKASFVLHTGDFVDFSTAEEWSRIEKALAGLSCPYLGTPGNHEHVKQGFSHYLRVTAQDRNAYMAHGPVLVVSLDSSKARLLDEDLLWLESVVEAHADRPLRFLLTHVPPWDPRPGEHHALGRKDAARLTEVVARLGFSAAFCGHVHCHAVKQFHGVPWHISAGAGAPLYALPRQGGFHHALQVHIEGDRAHIEVLPLEDGPGAVEILLRYRSTWARYFERWLTGKGRKAETYRHAFYRYARAIRFMEGTLRSQPPIERRTLLERIDALPPSKRAYLDRLRRSLRERAE